MIHPQRWMFHLIQVYLLQAKQAEDDEIKLAFCEKTLGFDPSNYQTQFNVKSYIYLKPKPSPKI